MILNSYSVTIIWKEEIQILCPLELPSTRRIYPASEVFVVENSPLGVEAANKGGLECNITE